MFEIWELETNSSSYIYKPGIENVQWVLYWNIPKILTYISFMCIYDLSIYK